MSKPSHKYSVAAIAGLLAVFAPVVKANQCGDISPLFQEMGERYYELDNALGSALIEQTIHPNRLIHTLQSVQFRSGEGQRTRCFGESPDSQRSKTLTLQDIEPARINSLNEIVLKVFEFDEQDKTARPATAFIPLSSRTTAVHGDNRLVVNTRHWQPVIRGTDINGNFIAVRGLDSGIVNRAVGLPGTHLREISMTVEADGNTIRIMQLIYVNGYLAERFDWTLNKPM